MRDGAAFFDPSLLPPEILSHPSAALALAVAGVVLVFFGQRVFWLVVAVTGALVALNFATRWLGLEAAPAGLVVALAAGLVGALLAVLVQKAAIALGGFLLGFGAGFVGASALGAHVDALASLEAQLAVAVVVGVLGAVLAGRVFTLALVLVSALLGAWLLVIAAGLTTTGAGLLRLDLPVAWVAFVTLSLVGVIFQGRRRRREEDRRSRRQRRREEKRQRRRQRRAARRGD